jgi:large subunit ribosomal protein L23
MNRNEYLYDVIRTSHISDKVFRLSQIDGTMMVLKVSPKASKKDIKAAVELAFNDLEVVSVNTSNVLGKSRRTRYGIAKTQCWKKAYIKLKDSEKLNEAVKNLNLEN